MIEIEGVDLVQQGEQFDAGGGEVVFHMGDGAGKFTALDDAEVEEFAEALVEDFFRDAGDVAFEFAGAADALADGGDDSGGPFATDDVLKPMVGTALADAEIPLCVFCHGKNVDVLADCGKGEPNCARLVKMKLGAW